MSIKIDIQGILLGVFEMSKNKLDELFILGRKQGWKTVLIISFYLKNLPVKFGSLYSGIQYRLLAFWDKEDRTETLVFATHGIIKKTSKVDKKEIDKAENIRANYLKNKKK